MRKRLIVLGTTLVAAVALSAPAAADHNAGPCNNSGEPGNSDFAEHHIAVMAHEEPGAVAEHNPGKTHQGFSACNPSGR